MSQKQYDVVIIGGGVTGSSIARNFALQKKRVLLILDGGIGSGSYGRSGGLLNSGFFLSNPNRKIIKKRLIEIERLYKSCGHLFMPTPVVWPFYNQEDQQRCVYLLEGGAGYEALQKGGEPTYLNEEELNVLLPLINMKKVLGGGIFDLWGIDPFRLAILLNLDFIKEGGEVAPRTVVESIQQEATSRYRIELKGNRRGPLWSDHVVDLRYQKSDILIREDYLIFERQFTPLAVVIKSDEEQQILLYPYHGVTILGPFRSRYYGQPVEFVPEKNIISFLLDIGDRCFPGLSKHRLLRGFSNYLPVEGDEGTITQEGGIFHVVSGGLIWGLDVAQRIAHQIGYTGAKEQALIEEDQTSYPFEEMAAYAQVSIFLVERLYYRYGKSFIDILKMMKNDPGLKRIVCQCEMITVAELVYAVQKEYGESFSDLMRRTRVGMGSCQGGRCIQEIDRLLRGILKERWDQKKILQFFEKRYTGQRHFLRREGVQELALKLSSDTLWQLTREY